MKIHIEPTANNDGPVYVRVDSDVEEYLADERLNNAILLI